MNPAPPSCSPRLEIARRPARKYGERAPPSKKRCTAKDEENKIIISRIADAGI